MSIASLNSFYFSSQSLYILNILKAKKEQSDKNEEIIYNIQNGIIASIASNVIITLCSCYTSFISFIVSGISIKGGWFGSISSIILISCPDFLGYAIVYIDLFYKNRYIKFFKQASRNGNEWHLKWRKRRIIFSLGSLLMLVLGVCAAWVILYF